MKNIYLITVFTIAGIFQVLMPVIASAQWARLFNGKDLEGWKLLNGLGKFEAVNGEIVGTTVFSSNSYSEPSTYLATNKIFSDFILEFEFLLTDAINSGVQVRSESKPEYRNGSVVGYQFEIDPSTRAWSGGIVDEARRDWLYPIDYNPAAKDILTIKIWNKCRIECIGNTVRTFINGKAAAHLVDDLSPNGFIALQVPAVYKPEDAGKQIRWRNIRINSSNLKPTALDDIFVVNLLPNNVSAQEKKNGVQLLFDGQTTDGWRAAYKDIFPEKGWEVKDGELRVLDAGGGESTNEGDIVTLKEYGAFILQFEFKFAEGANSGVKYFVTEKENNNGSAIGPEYQILDDEKHPDAKLGSIGNRTLASLYDLIPAVKQPRARKKPGEWNRGIVVVNPDGRVEHFLNGWKMLEFKRGTQYFYALVARSKYEKWPNFGMASTGHILLQDHGTCVSFRSIKLTEL